MVSPVAALLPDLVPLGRASDYLEEILEVLSPLALFEGFSAAECGELCEYLECFGAPSSTTIIREGEVGEFLMVVLTGRVQVVKRSSGGAGHVVAEVGPGGFVGEMSMIDGRPRFASCVSAEPTDLAVFTRDRLNAMMVDHPRLGQKFLLMLLRHSTGRLRDITVRIMPYLVDGAV